MMLGDYIAALEALRKEVGDLVEVEKWMPAKGRHSAPEPKILYARTYERNGLPAFYDERFDNPVQKGAPVIRV